MTYIYESWLASGEKWTKCSVYLNVTSNMGTRRRGVKKWLTYAEISKQYGERVATAIIEHKLASPELAEEEVRWHPDCPGNEASPLTCTNSTSPFSIAIQSTISSQFDPNMAVTHLCRKPGSTGCSTAKARRK